MLSGGNTTTISFSVNFMVLEVDGIDKVTLVKVPFLLLSLVDGLHYNNNTLPFTLGKY
jgi:hypothetical protein